MLEKIDCLNDHIDSLKHDVSVAAPDCFDTKEGGRVYSPAVRKLYYKLLADGLSPSKISSLHTSLHTKGLADKNFHVNTQYFAHRF